MNVKGLAKKIAGLLVPVLILSTLLISLTACGKSEKSQSQPPQAQKVIETPEMAGVEVFEIPLPKELKNDKDAPKNRRSPEFSAMTWYKDYLIMVPQFQEASLIKRDQNPALLAVRKEDILSRIPKAKGQPPVETSPLPYKKVPVEISETLDQLIHEELGEQFEGFEAIGFYGNKVFLAIETEKGGKAEMTGYLISGSIDEQLTRVTLDSPDPPVKIDPPAVISNAAFESMIVTDKSVILLFEGNGKSVNPKPVAFVYDHELRFAKEIPFPPVEFRITDATRIDEHNRFWCINYFWPGDASSYRVPPSLIKKGSREQVLPLEQLLQFRLDDSGITQVENRVVHLRLKDYEEKEKGIIDSKDGRNWEGIVTLFDENNRFLGFLLLTDEWPNTILGYVPHPSS